MVYIKEIIKQRGETVNSLADKLGISRQALSRQLSGKLLVETAEKIAAALGVEVWQLFRDPSAPCVDGCRCPHCGKPIKLTAG